MRVDRVTASSVRQQTYKPQFVNQSLPQKRSPTMPTLTIRKATSADTAAITAL